ncbi:MAG: transporter [Halobacteriales archaeon]
MDGDGFDRGSIPLGTIAGIFTYLLGYLITYLWKATAVANALRGINVLAQLLGVEAIPTWKGVAWLYYSAHFVSIRFPSVGGTSQRVDLIATADDPELVMLYFLVVVLLVGAGAVVTVIRRQPGASVFEDSLAGTMITVGYGLAAVTGAVLSTHAIQNADISIAPDLITAILLAGLVYPAVCGGIGGLLARAITARERPSPPSA